jgi:hypothetical protein
MEELREKHNSPEGKLDKNGNPRKFTRDLDSDWTIQNDKPHFGLKEHTSVDTKNGFILATTLSPDFKIFGQNDIIGSVGSSRKGLPTGTNTRVRATN